MNVRKYLAFGQVFILVTRTNLHPPVEIRINFPHSADNFELKLVIGRTKKDYYLLTVKRPHSFRYWPFNSLQLIWNVTRFVFHEVRAWHWTISFCANWTRTRVFLNSNKFLRKFNIDKGGDQLWTYFPLEQGLYNINVSCI